MILIWLPRRKLEELVHSPHFESTVVGCFVRFVCSENLDKSKIYAIGKVISFIVTDKIYELGGTQTNKNLLLSYHSQDFLIKLKYVCNKVSLINFSFLFWCTLNFIFKSKWTLFVVWFFDQVHLMLKLQSQFRGQCSLPT